MSHAQTVLAARVADLWARAETMRRFGYMSSYHVLADKALRLEASMLGLRGLS